MHVGINHWKFSKFSFYEITDLSKFGYLWVIICDGPLFQVIVLKIFLLLCYIINEHLQAKQKFVSKEVL